jgi:hypothetical protein
MLELAIYPQSTHYVSSGKLIAFWKDSDVFHTLDHAVAPEKDGSKINSNHYAGK